MFQNRKRTRKSPQSVTSLDVANSQIYHKHDTEFGEPYQPIFPFNLDSLIAEPPIGEFRLQLAVQGLLCQSQKSGSGFKDHVQAPDLCIYSS